MQGQDLWCAFAKAEQYAFLFENAPLLLLAWERDDAKFLFLIKEVRADGLVLDYPGQAFTDRVLDTISQVFFIQVAEGEQPSRRYVLGSLFHCAGRMYGAYYERDAAEPNVVLFRLQGEAPDFELVLLDETEYEQAAAAFAEQHQDWLEIQGLRGTP
ncbi:MAG: hypothetical protein K6T31_08265 [Alicyclobacillus sp.]|nr:hypothetical protein [Alicyclobacillus sp.]